MIDYLRGGVKTVLSTCICRFAAGRYALGGEGGDITVLVLGHVKGSEPDSAVDAVLDKEHTRSIHIDQVLLSSSLKSIKE